MVYSAGSGPLIVKWKQIKINPKKLDGGWLTAALLRSK